MLLAPNDKSGKLVKQHGIGLSWSFGRILAGFSSHDCASTEFRHTESVVKSKRWTKIGEAKVRRPDPENRLRRRGFRKPFEARVCGRPWREL